MAFQWQRAQMSKLSSAGEADNSVILPSEVAVCGHPERSNREVIPGQTEIA
jgi:hypothetical protein